MRISDWSSDVCSSDLITRAAPQFSPLKPDLLRNYELGVKGGTADGQLLFDAAIYYIDWRDVQQALLTNVGTRSEEHTSELQSLMRISYAVFCLKKKTKQ